MAILDIQIVSASLSQIQAGLSASSDEITWVQTSYLIAEVIMIPLSGFLSRVVSTRVIFTISAGGFTLMSFMCAQAEHDRGDDPLARAAGLHRRRHDPDGVRLGLHHLPARQAADHRADHRARGDARPDHRPDGRRLSDRLVLLALAVPGQPRSGNHRHRRRLAADRFRRARLVAADPFRLFRPPHHGGLSRGARICARGGAVEGLVRERAGDDRHRRLGGQRRPLLLARVHRQAADRRPHRLSRPQFLDRHDVRLRARHRALRPHLHLSGLSRGRARLFLADDRQDDVRHRRLHVPDRAAGGPADDPGRPAPDDRDRLRPLCGRHLSGVVRHRRLGLLGAPAGRRSSAASG